MSGFISFAETLERKIKKDLEKGQYSDSSFGEIPLENTEFSTEYVNLSYILGRTHRLDSQNSSRTKIKTPYDQYRPKPKPRYPHNLSKDQTLAYMKLCRYSDLHPGFQAQELKKAFREAVKASHPDLGGTPESFAEVHAAYQTLKKILK